MTGTRRAAPLARFVCVLGALDLTACFVDGGAASDPTDALTSSAAPDPSSDADTRAGEDPTTTGTATPGACGDAIQDPDEQCDHGVDHNGVDGSFCRADCTTNLCGDAYLASDEGCDDGNLAAGDGCNASCQLEVCGDGAPGPGELCDDGNDVDTDACTNACVPAACGDGVVHTDAEDCDDGNLESGDGCSPTCVAEVCGNGTVEFGELCDDGDLDDGDGCSAACQRDAYFVFVTSETYPGTFGGITQADSRCAELAAAAGLPGVYLAWLSAGADAPATRLFQSPLPYILRDGTIVAEDWNDLTDGTLAHPISQTETGAPLNGKVGCSAETAVWTATKANGTAADTDYQCLGWTFPIGSGRVGDSASVNGTWTSLCNIPCQTALRLYCFEQGT